MLARIRFDSCFNVSFTFSAHEISKYELCLQEMVDKRYNRTGGDNPWFVFGVSYPGALSAWFRLKFPHLVRGSLSSSGVVLAVYNYTAFDEQVQL